MLLLVVTVNTFGKKASFSCSLVISPRALAEYETPMSNHSFPVSYHTGLGSGTAVLVLSWIYVRMKIWDSRTRGKRCTFNNHAYMMLYALPYEINFDFLACDRTHVGAPDDAGREPHPGHGARIDGDAHPPGDADCCLLDGLGSLSRLNSKDRKHQTLRIFLFSHGQYLFPLLLRYFFSFFFT